MGVGRGAERVVGAVPAVSGVMQVLVVKVVRGEIRRGTISIIIMAPKTENQANWAYLEGTERLVRQVTTGSMV